MRGAGPELPKPGGGGRAPHRQDLLAGSSQQDGAGFGVFALRDEGEILIADLLHLKQPRPQAHVVLAKLVRPADDPSSARPDASHRQADTLVGSQTRAGRPSAASGYLAMRLLSVFLTRRMAVMLAFIR